MNARAAARDAATSPLHEAIAACLGARVPSRSLDARIAVALFPALAGLPSLGVGLWRHEDGSRVRALLYSSSCAAAATLVPQGCWVEPMDEGAKVAGSDGEWVGKHTVEPIALCLAALRARLPACDDAV